MVNILLLLECVAGSLSFEQGHPGRAIRELLGVWARHLPISTPSCRLVKLLCSAALEKPCTHQSNQISTLLQATVGLDSYQTRIVHRVWSEASEALAKLREEQAEITSQMGSFYEHPTTQSCSERMACFRDGTLLRQVADLSENARLQAEVAINAIRKLVWQVCSPENMARLMCFNWPYIPDFLYCVQSLAASSEGDAAGTSQ